MNDWHQNILTDSTQIRQLLSQIQTVAVLGIKTEAQAEQPAFYVPQSLAEMGLTIIPVPVYYPEATQILGQTVYRKLVDIPQEIDIVNVFRRPQDIPGHLDDILAKSPRAVWFQAGIQNDQAAQTLAEAGIQVVQNRCLMVEFRALRG